jgi:anti-sigma factor RsiW
MTECDVVQPLSTAWVDGELGASERVRVNAHVELCGACRSRLAAESAARTLLREHRQALRADEPAPAALRERCRSAIAARARSSTPRRLRAAVAATVALAAGGWLFHVVTERSTTVLAAQLAADHVKCHLLTQAQDPDPGVVQRRLLAQYGFETPVPPSSPDGRFRLIGAGRCLTGEGTNAHMLYEFDGRPVSLYLIPSDSRPPADLQVLGKHASVWSRHNGTYVLIAEREAADLARLAAYVQHATE